MKCSKCGASLVEDARFCGECGSPVTAASAALAAARGAARPAPRPPQAALADTMIGNSDVAVLARAAAAAAAPPAAARSPGRAEPEARAPPSAPAARPLDPNDLVGATLNNRYRVTGRIGEGGFGAVYRGEQIAMGRECAIKVLHPRMARDPQVVGRFRREAQAASMLRDPHTVATYDFDQTPEGILYMAMELLHGRSLHQELNHGPIAYRRVAHILLGVLESLSEAHAHGIVHRDIKPENVFLETRGGDSDYAKVLDFGIAKIVSGDGNSSGPQLTAAGQTLGTVEFMSPEQLMGQQLDGRSDLYAIGHLAYEMLCGHLPFNNVRTPGEIITAHLRAPVRPPSEATPALGIPRSMDAVVLRLLEKQRDNRYRDAAAAKADLRKVLAGEAEPELVTYRMPTDERAASGPTPRGAGPTPAVRPDGSTTTEMLRQASAGARGPLFVLLGVVFLVIALVAAWFLLAGRASADERPPSREVAVRASPARLIPPAFEALFAVDMASLRAATPAQTLAPLFDALRPRLAEVGATPEQVERLAVGMAGARAGALSGRAAAEAGAVLIADLPVEGKRLEAVARRRWPADRWSDASSAGLRYRKSSRSAYVLLPGPRVAIGSSKGFAAMLALAGGRGTGLVDGRAAGLLARVGVGAGRAAPAYGWLRLDEQDRRRLDARLPGTAAIGEVAHAIEFGAQGADVIVLAACATAEGAQAAQEAVRAALEGARRDPMVLLLGFGRLLETLRVDTDGNSVRLAAHLSPAQLADLVARAGGLLASYERTALADAADAAR